MLRARSCSITSAFTQRAFLRRASSSISSSPLLSQSNPRHLADDGRLAILIDADNVPARLAAPLLEEVRLRVGGHHVDRRVYGDFSLSRIEAWKTAALELGIEMKMQASPSKTKNATDIALCIDAMDILHAPHSLVDTFVIVTNDGDFAPLAQRLRRAGKRVIAVGTGPALIASCDAHVLVDFKRSPQPSAHTAADVQLLVDLVYDMGHGSSAGGGKAHSSKEGSSWVEIGHLASMVDRKHPGWRRPRMADFINFRHLLETEPYRSSFETRVHSLHGRKASASLQLRPYARDLARTRRASREAAERRGGGGSGGSDGGSTGPESEGTATKQTSWWSRWTGWLMGAQEKPPLAAHEHDGEAASAKRTEPLSPDDVGFVVEVLSDAASTGDANGSDGTHWTDKRATPEGDGWVHLSMVAVKIDDAAVASGRGRDWRSQLQAVEGSSTLRALLTREPFVGEVELESVRQGPTSVDWFVRRRTAAAARPEP